MMTNGEADKKPSGICADQAASRIDAPSEDSSDIKIDLSDVQGDSGMTTPGDQEERIRAAVEEAERRKPRKWRRRLKS